MLIDLVISKVKESAERLITYVDYDPAITAALARYSKHRPLEVVADLDGNGTNDLELPGAWVPEFSKVISVEYPIGEIPATLLAADEWLLYRTPLTTKLRLLQEAPAATEDVRLTFTGVRVEADVPEIDLDAVASLAASICLLNLAALAAQTSDPTIAADVVDYQSKADVFRRLATALETKYYIDLGIDQKAGPAAASATATATTSRTLRLTHGGR